MAEFKRIDNQQVYSLEVYDADAVNVAGNTTYKVGVVFSRNQETKEIAVVATATAAQEAIADGKTLYLMAQSSAVTEKTGTGYKNYNISKDVTVSTSSDTPTVVAAYRVDNIDNIIW